MSIILYFIFVIALLHYQSTLSIIIARTRIRNIKPYALPKSASNFSKYIYMIDDLTTVTTTTDSDSFTDICNASIDEDDEPDTNKRSMQFWFDNSSGTTRTTTEAFEISHLSDEFLNCTHTTVEPECYKKYQNGTVFVPLYNMLFDQSNYVINQDLLFVCPNFFDDIEEEKFSSSIGIASLVGVSVSTACIILHILMFALVERLRNLPGYCLISLCSALLVAYMTSFVQFALSENANCTVIGMVVFYGLLSSFFWMNVISFDVWLSIRMATIKLRLSSDQPFQARFAIYSSYAWGLPLLIVIASLITDHLTTDASYKLIFKVETCWFQHKTALLIYFATPLFIVLSMNILFFIASFYMITQSAMTRKESGNQFGSDLRSRLFMSFRLGSAMGLMWIFGVVATVTQRQWIYYVYSVFNAMQGVFIFFSFTVNKKTIKACKTVIRRRKSSMLPSGSQQVSSI